MAAESIGNLIPTKIPGYADTADIQAALRLYHYGSYDFDTTETDPESLINPSVAYTINDIQDQIDALDLGISPTVLSAKGDLISASGNDTPLVISVGSNGTFLKANSATSTGLEWSSLPSGNTSTAGILQLSDSISSTSTTLAATANAVKQAYDLANAAISATTFDNKGDLVVATGDGTYAKLAAGPEGYVLAVNSSTSTGLEWQDAPTGSGGGQADVLMLMGG